jgi:hypothetical protein
MIGRFREMCALAEKHDLKLVVGLITGWMSGRLFVPPALEVWIVSVTRGALLGRYDLSENS